MRLTRGLLASLGASTSLVLAATVALFSVSTIVAFRGWPGMDVAVPGPGQQIAVSDADPASSITARRIVIPRASAPPRRPPASAPHARRASGTSSAPAVVTRPAQPARRNLPPAPAAAPKAPAASAPAARPKLTVPPPGDPVREVGDGLGRALGGVAGGLGDTVRPVSPALGETLDQVGSGLDQRVKDITGTVGLLLDTVLSGAGSR